MGCAISVLELAKHEVDGGGALDRVVTYAGICIPKSSTSSSRMFGRGFRLAAAAAVVPCTHVLKSTHVATVAAFHRALVWWNC